MSQLRPFALRDQSLAAPVAESVGWSDLDVRAVDTARILAADAVQKVGNGHPGTAMSLAPVAYLLYQNVMKLDPADPMWLGRDRFVLSNGHSSLTQYVQLYLAGIGLELDDLKALRTWRSKTPGHPEVHHTTGVEITTGPLGSGLASAVGMAMAQRRQRGIFDPESPVGESPFDHHVYVVAGDGCLQEGVASEACSLAGHQQLGNLTLVYDSNYISIEDRTDISFSEDVAGRFTSYGWDVRHVDWRQGPGGEAYVEDVDALHAAIEEGRRVADKPTIVILDTVIAWPAPTLQDTGKSHGAALGAEEIRATKKLLGFDPDADFAVDDAVIAHTREGLAVRARAERAQWDSRFEAWRAANPQRAALLDRVLAHETPEGFEEAFPVFPADAKGIATRAASGKVLSALAEVMPELWGGSADLAESNNTTMDGQPSFVPAEHQTRSWQGGPYGRTLHFGIRENAMGMILNGIALEGLTRPYGGTFLTFSDFMRPAVRLAALQKMPAVFVWTHDSVGLGEDGPTHQPIEHIPSLRLIPNLEVVRPADANETAVAWRTILRSWENPKAILLTRQAVPTVDRERYASAEGVAKGAYVLADCEGEPQVVLMATGSEVQLALSAYETLSGEGIRARVVSMPCWEWFAAQSEEYRESVLPSGVRARVAVEAAHSGQWREFVGDAGVILSIDHFGESASGAKLFEEYGFTAERVVAAAKQTMSAVEGAR
ncbi:transketolase [Austwickia chelonae]|uniref:Transketolase n=1 Tax=Austwickia chelonae NBRC 105200 TaxID=1184607 RepID=K6V4U8_9MICO|nr:transketolase [Austwickia chelonae]GAB77198.1 transketolase [Austwickia chelonae NBRC 105200]SEW04961.1 transketolase [Austwickia chelonae]